MDRLRYSDFLSDFPVFISEASFTGRKTSVPHRHEFYEIFLVRAGMLEHTINSRQEILPERSVSLIRPDDVHAFQSADKNPACITNIAFSSGFFSQALQVFSESQRRSIDRTSHSMQCDHSLWQVLIDKLNIIRQADPFLCDQTCLLTMALVIDALIPIYFSKNAPDNTPIWLQLAFEQMKRPENYFRGLDQFAELAGRSIEHLTRTMTRTMGITPGNYVMRLRLQHAAGLLSTTDRTVLDILLDSGFNNTAWFNRAFKRMYGITAGRYRQKNRKMVCCTKK